MKHDRYPVHGAGLGLRRTLLGQLADLPSIPLDFFEVAPENWIGPVLWTETAIRLLQQPSLLFADAIKLVDRKDLYENHADFLSRLALTFSHGDYASIEAIPHKDEVAERLFKRALSYFPDHRAYLGLGILKQKEGKYRESIALLSEGVKHFPASEQLTLCLGISHMNLAQYQEALKCFNRFPDAPALSPYREACRRALGHSGEQPPYHTY